MASSNRALLDRLLLGGDLDLAPSDALDAPPPALPSEVPWARVEGMMLGLAAGDALGNTSEGLLPDERRRRHGVVTHYLPNPHAERLPYGLPSDDAQMAFWTLEHLLEVGRLDAEWLLARFSGERIHGIGSAVSEAVANYRRGVRPWHRCAPRSAGNGALMRIAPVLIPHLRTGTPDLWADTVLAAATTHNDRASLSACVAWVAILWQLLAMDRPPEPEWWRDAYVGVAAPLEGETEYRARGGSFAGYAGPMWRFVAERLTWAHGEGLSVIGACNAWYSGAYLLETLPSVLFILMRHADDPEVAIVRAVNDTIDNDTIAAIVGSAVGALHGRDALPMRWLDGLSGRTRERDSGRMFELLAEARTAFGALGGASSTGGASSGAGRGDLGPSGPSPGPGARAGDPPVPLPQTYWVEPGRLLAGEYPGAPGDDEARQKLRALLRAGVDLFIDLTEPGESGLRPYAHLLTEEAAALGSEAEHRRLAIADFHVPTVAHMRAVLDAIDSALGAGRTVYLHCWGGVGRTGTVVGCYLVRHGLTGEEALERVAALYRSTPKGQRRPDRPSPETAAQAEFVRDWATHEPPTPTGAGDAPAPAIVLLSRFRGALLGLAVGDALGTTLEFTPPGPHDLTDMVGGGPFELPAGAWTDDTSMALCLATSLVERRGFDPADQMARYVRWWREGYLSSTGTCFDIGSTTGAALARYERTGDPYAGSEDPHSAGNGSLMRLAPVALYYAHRARVALERAGDSSRTTHAAPAAVDACRYYAGLLVGALDGRPKEELVAPRFTPVAGYWEERPLCPEVDAVAAGSFRDKGPPDIRGTGYVVRTLEAALWAFGRTGTFREGCLQVVNLGEDADTTGAVYGQLAGAYYGEEGIPPEWRAKVVNRALIESLAEALYALSRA